MGVNQQAFATSATAAAAAQTAQSAGRPSSFTPGQMGLMSPVGSVGSGGEMYEKLYAALQNNVKMLTEERKSDSSYFVVKLLKQTAGLNYSNIILVEKQEDCVAAHVLIVESTGMYPDVRIETAGNVRYEIVRTPADALDEKLVEQAQIAVGQALKMNPAEVVIVDGTLVPSEFAVSDEHQVSALVINTFNATFTEIQTRVHDYKGQNVQELIANNRNGKFQIGVAYNENDLIFTDQTGMPVRQDICISLSYKLGNSQNGWSVHQGENTVEVAKTYGYIDFEYVGPQLVNNQPTSQCFVPNFIITHIESPFAPTPDLVMRAVLSVFALNEGMNWLPAFRAAMTKKGEIDLADIGALNIEGNIEANPVGYGKKYDTKSKSFNNMELTQFVQRLVYPGKLAVSMDLPKAGPETWYTSLFHAIQFEQNPAIRQGAMDRLNRFLIHSTGNVFQPANLPVFINTTNKIHGGFYRDPVTKTYRDLRCVTNYLAVANHVADTNQPPAKISQYTNTLYSHALPAELRAAVRRDQYVTEMTNNSAVIKRYYDRVTFSRDYLQNYLNAMQSIGYAPMFANMVNNEVFVTRATGDFANALFGQDARLMGTAPTQYGNYGQFSAYHRTY
jgi:hypothetical protein